MVLYRKSADPDTTQNPCAKPGGTHSIRRFSAESVIATCRPNVGDERRNVGGCVLGVHADGAWRLEARVAGDELTRKDVDAHVRSLLAILRPHAPVLRAWAEQGEALFDVMWQSSNLAAGSGAVFAPDCVQGIAELGAALGLDVVAIDEASE